MEKPLNATVEDSILIPDDLKVGEVNILSGKKAKEMISSIWFQKNWDQLYADCPWSTAFQKRQFVSTWYATFENEITPIIALSTSYTGEMSGLLTLATRGNIEFPDKMIKIFGAGEFESEYQDWITTSGNRDSFIIDTFNALLQVFPKCNIVLRFVSKQSFSEKLSEDPYLKPKLVIQRFRRPLMDTNSPEIDQILKLQRQFKNKYRKLNQLGKVKFEKIIDFNEFKTSFETLMAQFDFRQGAMFNKNQFLENPNKRNFFYGLFKQGLLHVTLLKIDDEIIASMIGASDKKWVHLQGVNTHSPAYGKFSPGILHFYLLGDLIRKERGVFDLTPGLDEYKERWATDHDWVYTITLTQNRQFYIKRFLKKNIHSTLIKLGFKPMKVELLLEKKVYLLKKKWNLRRLNTLWKKENLIPRRLSLPLDKKFDQLSITENNLSDLLKYEETKGNLSRWEFMESVMNEMGNGKVIFSHTKDEKMVAMISFEKKETKNGPVKDDINCKNTSHTLENLYFHPDTTEEQLVSFFRSVCNTIYSKYNISEVLFLHDEKKSQLFKEIL